jgi:ribonuclease Z
MTLRITFLGTSGAIPTTERSSSGILVNIHGDKFLFDAGEGIQRQMMHYGTGFGIQDIFLTHIHGDHIFGLLGLIQTMDFNGREDSLFIHTPLGTKNYLDNLVALCGTGLGYLVITSETHPNTTVKKTPDYEIKTFKTDHKTSSTGYALIETQRKGRFFREKAEELGVPVGKDFSILHEGNSITLKDGTIVSPEQVIGPPRPGRKIAYTGDTRPTKTTIEAVSGFDLLIHDSTFTEEYKQRAELTGHSTALEAADLATEADISHLVLTHISSRFSGNPKLLLNEAKNRFKGELTLAHDGLEIDIPYTN